MRLRESKEQKGVFLEAGDEDARQRRVLYLHAVYQQKRPSYFCHDLDGYVDSVMYNFSPAPIALHSATTFSVVSVPGGTFRPPKTKAHTATIPVAPAMYAVSRPAHQYKVQKIRGPSARPACPGRSEERRVGKECPV